MLTRWQMQTQAYSDGELHKLIERVGHDQLQNTDNIIV